MGVSVRKAVTEDIDWCLGQLQAFGAYYRTKKPLFPTDAKYARDLLGLFISFHLVLIAERDGHPVGLVAGFISPHPFNPGIRAITEQFWWVMPEHRGSSAGLRLIDAFVTEAEKVADWITVSLEHGSPVSDRCLIRRGFRPLDHQYLKEVG